MAKTNARVVMNRKALDEVQLAIADGMEAVCREIVKTARPPDATPFGEGLVTRGGWLVYNGSKKIAGGSLDGKQPKKPRAMTVRGQRGISAIAGFGFPGRFQEMGTVNHSAQPFLWPAFEAVADDIPRIMKPAVVARLRAPGAGR